MRGVGFWLEGASLYKVLRSAFMAECHGCSLLQESEHHHGAMFHGCSQQQGHTGDAFLTMVMPHHGYIHNPANPAVSKPFPAITIMPTVARRETLHRGWNHRLASHASLYLNPHLFGCSLLLACLLLSRNAQHPRPALGAYTWTWSACT